VGGEKWLGKWVALSMIYLRVGRAREVHLP